MQQLGRKIVQRLEVDPGTRVWLSFKDPALDEAVRAILQVSGAQVVEPDSEELNSAALQTQSLSAALVPDELIDELERVPAGTCVLVVTNEAEMTTSLEVYAERQGRRLGLFHCSGVIVGEQVVIRGERRERPRGAKLRELRGMGHSIDPSVLVGRGGLTDEVMSAAEQALARHGLVKVKLTPQCSLEKREAARSIAWGIGGDLVQRIGKTALVWRRDVRLDPPGKQRGRR